MKQIRVLHGTSGAAGQPRILSLELRKLGLKSDNIIEGKSKFGYEADFFIDIGIKNQIEFLKEHIDEYDIFHFYFRPFFFYDTKKYSFPTGSDLLLLKAMGKKIVFHYRGSEVRYASKFKEFTKYNYVDENPNRIFTKFPEKNVLIFMKFIESIADIIMVPDPELNSYVKNAKIVPRAIDIKKWPNIGIKKTKRPLVVHAPSRRIVKGTDYILSAVDKLKEEGIEFDFELIENKTNIEAKKLYEQADIVIDQLRIGWYGVLCVECMALGKPVICYIRDDLLNNFDRQNMPFINGNPDNIYNVLKETISDYSFRQSISINARQYVENAHDVEIIAKKLNSFYEVLLKNKPKKINHIGIIDFLDYQNNTYSNAIKKMTKFKVDKNFLGDCLYSYKRYLDVIREQGFIEANKKLYNKIFL